jgi:NitT/TauT family transport system substrate-binding protein
VSKEGMASYFQWLKADFGFNESKVKPYTFNAQPFLTDKNSAMQGYVTSEPFAVERQGGFRPAVFLLADHGFDAYSTLIETRRDLVEKRSDLVQRFVDASASDGITSTATAGRECLTRNRSRPMHCCLIPSPR